VRDLECPAIALQHHRVLRSSEDVPGVEDMYWGDIGTGEDENTEWSQQASGQMKLAAQAARANSRVSTCQKELQGCAHHHREVWQQDAGQMEVRQQEVQQQEEEVQKQQKAEHQVAPQEDAGQEAD
jgi:hypothetical protein